MKTTLKIPLFALIFAGLFTACKTTEDIATPLVDQSTEGEIHNRKDLEANKANQCDIFGTYVWVDPRKGSYPEPDPENCQAAIRLEDGTLVYLQPTWESSAARSKTELLEYKEKAVVVTGFLSAEGLPSPDDIAYIIGPCLVGPILISDRKVWNLMHGGELKLD